MNLISQLEAYKPVNNQEKVDKEVMLEALRTNPLIFTRESKLAHMTASAWTLNKKRDKVLMAYHHIYDSWSWLGGHADGQQDLLRVAMREVKEESGVSHVTALIPDIYSIEILTVDGHIKRGEYVPSHLHLNVTYLLEADEHEQLVNKPDENSDVAWFSLSDSIEASSEEWFKDNIYSKLNEKLARLSFN